MLIGSDYQNQRNTSFTGMTKTIGKRIFVDGKKNVLEYLSGRPVTNTQVGELPPTIFYRLPVENRESRIKEIFSVFSDCANELREYRAPLNAPREERVNKRPNSVVEKLRNVLVKHNVLEKPEEFDLEYLGAGEYKKAYLIKGLKDEKTGDKICYKVFHTVDTTPEWHKYKCHGNYSEINIATYWKKQEGNKTNLNKFYAGDIYNGYLMDRFVDLDVARPKKIVDVYNYGVRNIDAVHADTGHNKLHGFCIDEGGSRVVNIVKNRSKIARYVLKRIKSTPERFRNSEWHTILRRKDLDDTQKKAGLALSIKHFPTDDQTTLIEECLAFNKPLVDQALGYALKYIPREKAEIYYETLMKRNNPQTQTVLMNEIPLLSMKGTKYDDVNVPKQAVDAETIARFYDISKRTVLPEVEEHLTSYVHLLPKERILPEANELIERNNYKINDRFLHKIKYLAADEYSYGDKMEVINNIQKINNDPFIDKKANETRLKVIRDSLCED